jgi:hypothetical protein
MVKEALIDDTLLGKSTKSSDKYDMCDLAGIGHG